MTSINQDTLRSNIENTVRRCLMGHKDGADQNDASIISRGLAADCQRHIIPDSFIEALGVKPPFILTNQQYQEAFASDITVSKAMRTDILDLTIDAPARRAAARTDNDPLVGDENFRLEFTWFFNLNEDGTEITRIVEFADSVEALKFETKVDTLVKEKMAGRSSGK